MRMEKLKNTLKIIKRCKRNCLLSGSSCEHCNAEISDCLALVWICALAHTYNAVLFTADRTNFEAIKAKVKEKMELFGSVGKA